MTINDIFYEILSKYEANFARVFPLDYQTIPDDKLLDPVYGEIYLDNDIIYLLSQPIVERLSRIRQLAMTHLTYIGASHTRLEHSLGVSHIITTIPENLDEFDKKILRIVGLLHDLGHSGWGHALDGIVAKIVEQTSRDNIHFIHLPTKLDIAITSYLLLEND